MVQDLQSVHCVIKVKSGFNCYTLSSQLQDRATTLMFQPKFCNSDHKKLFNFVPFRFLPVAGVVAGPGLVLV